MAYDFGTKKHWRRWAWNRLAERLSVRPSEARVVYLATADDFDRMVALSKGFRSQNLIACTTDKAAVKAIRKAGGWAINHLLEPVVMGWPSDWPLDGIIGDFCSGLSMDALGFGDAVLFTKGIREVDGLGRVAIVANMLRGRDAISNPIRDRYNVLVNDAPDPKHRGSYLLCYMADRFADSMEPPSEEEQLALFGKILTGYQWAFHSYRSTAGSQVFDSCAARITTARVGIRKCSRKMKRARLSIGAVRAWQTRKQAS